MLRALLVTSAITFAAVVAASYLVSAMAHMPPPPALLVIAGGVLVAALVVPTVYSLLLAPMQRAVESGPAVNDSVITNRTDDTETAPAPAPVLTDPFTGLPARRGITTALLEAMAHAERYGDPFSIALVTLALPGTSSDWNRRGAARMAAVFAETLRMPDKAGHYGDRSFLVLLPHTRLADAAIITDRIRAEAARHEVECEGRKVPLEITIGTAQFRKGDDLAELQSRAEKSSQAGAARAPAASARV
jgi:diguanylate cyclase (GGDEF)-like protein